jgi:hypothetical protein
MHLPCPLPARALLVPATLALLGLTSAAPALGAATLNYRLSSSSALLQARDAAGNYDVDFQQDHGTVIGTPNSPGGGSAAYDFDGFATDTASSAPFASYADGVVAAESAFTGLSGPSSFGGFTFKGANNAYATRSANAPLAIGRSATDADHNVFFTIAAPHTYTIDLEGSIAMGSLINSPSRNATIGMHLRQSTYNLATGEGSYAGVAYENHFLDQSAAGIQTVDLSETGTLPAGSYWFRVYHSASVNAAGSNNLPLSASGEVYIDTGAFTLTPVPVPEPTAVGVILGAGAIMMRRRR